MITTTALTKSYDNARVVSDVSLHCEPGTITGFLGPNGAGKSTTLKMIVGLARPDHGMSTVDGHPFVDLPNPTRVVGTLLDPSAMHAGRTGRATLTIAARMAGVPTARVEELLDRVGLTDAAMSRGLSLGHGRSGHLFARGPAASRHRCAIARRCISVGWFWSHR